MSQKKTQPTPRQRDALRAQKAHGTNLREWVHTRGEEVAKLLRKLTARRKKKAETAGVTRGVDRVPERYRVAKPEPQWIARHEDLPRDYRRARGYTATSGNTPYVNPRRDAKSRKAGRLRKELL